MSRPVILAAAAAALLAGGCAQTDRVLFVTSSSLGINVDSKPATASIAYDRTEGFIGPRYDNGGLPPVVAMIDSDGGLFQPRVRQLYATGAAATKAVGGSATGPTTLTGQRRLAFFGTTTTTGLKIGFGEAAPIPDSFIFGFKREEASLIPLATTVNQDDEEVDVYASVLGSYDSRMVASGTPGGTEFNMRQFFATGVAAEELATSESIQGLFADAAGDSLQRAVSGPAYTEAIAAGRTFQAAHALRVKNILDSVAPVEAVDASALEALIAGASPTLSVPSAQALRTARTRSQLHDLLELNVTDVQRLTAGLKAAASS